MARTVTLSLDVFDIFHLAITLYGVDYIKGKDI